MSARLLCLQVHRWSGLFLAGFLTVAGLTGATLAWYDELEALLIPALVTVEPRGRTASPFELARIAGQLEPRATVNFIRLSQAPHAAAIVSLAPLTDPQTDRPHVLDYDEVFMDPYSGKVLGTRLWGEVRFDLIHLMPLVDRLHRSFLLGWWGERLLGVAALVWSINCFIGFYLTLPARKKDFLRNWKRSWVVRRGGSFWRWSFDLHRAAGLWFWAMLLVFALSALHFNLNEAIFRPLLTLVLPVKDGLTQLPPSAAGSKVQLGWEEAHARGKALMTEHAAREGFTVDGEVFLMLDRDQAAYTYGVRSSLDIWESGGQTQIAFSAGDGRELGFHHPRIASGNLFTSWLAALHTREVWGRPYQAFVSLTGLALAMMAITGVAVWFKRRMSRRR